MDNKPKFNIYTKVKTNPTPFLYSNQTSFNSKKMKSKKTESMTSIKQLPYYRCTTPLNKISSSTQIYHPSNLPLIGARSPVSRKLNFQSEFRRKTPNQRNNSLTINNSLSNTNSNSNTITNTITHNNNIKRELQIILALKKQIKSQNELIAQNTEEINEMKKMKNVSYVKEIKIENNILLNQIEKLKKLIDGMNSENSMAIEGIDGIECNTAVEIQQKRIIKLQKEENNKLSLALFGLSQDQRINEALKETINQYDKEIKELRNTNEQLNKVLNEKSSCEQNTIQIQSSQNEKVKKTDKHSLILIPPLISEQEKTEIEYLLKQCLIAKGIKRLSISEIIKDRRDFDNIESTIIQLLNLENEDKWILRRYLVDLAIDKQHLKLSFNLLIERLSKLFKIESGENEAVIQIENCFSNLNAQHIKDIIKKCQAIDIEQKETILFNQFKSIYCLVVLKKKNHNDLLSMNNFCSIIRYMKSNKSTSLMELNFKSFKSLYKENKNENENLKEKDQLLYTSELSIEEDVQIISQSQRINKNSLRALNYQQLSINQIELISLLTSYFKKNNISFQSFLLSIDSNIKIESDIKSISIIDFTNYLKAKNILQKQYSILFDKEYLSNHLMLNLTKISILFSQIDKLGNEDEEDKDIPYSYIDKAKTLTFKLDQEAIQTQSLSQMQLPSEYEQAKAIVSDIFEMVLHKQYLKQIKSIESNEVSANQLIEEIFAKVAKNYNKKTTNSRKVFEKIKINE